MIYRKEGYAIEGEEIFLDTASLRDNLGVLTHEVKINGQQLKVSITIEDRAKSEEECSMFINVKAKIDNKNIEYSEEADIEKIFEGVFNAIKYSTDFVLEKNLKEVISIAVGNALRDIANKNLMEEVAYNDLIAIYSKDDKLIGTATGFTLKEGKGIEIYRLDIHTDDDYIKLKKYNEDSMFVIELEKSYFNSSELYTVKSAVKEDLVDVPDFILNKREESSFADSDEYNIYRRSIILNQENRNEIGEGFLDDLWD